MRKSGINKFAVLGMIAMMGTETLNRDRNLKETTEERKRRMVKAEIEQ